jgi:hypothetical protein
LRGRDEKAARREREEGCRGEEQGCATSELREMGGEGGGECYHPLPDFRYFVIKSSLQYRPIPSVF